MPWKLYVDSRKRVKNSFRDSDSDFSIQLPYPITVSGKAYIDVVLLTNAFYTIRANDNDSIYLDELASTTKRIATIAEGQYNVYELRDQLVIALNANKQVTGQYRVTYLPTRNRYQIDLVNAAANDSFRIWTEHYLYENADQWVTAFPTLDKNALHTANRPCGFLEGTTLNGTNTIAIQAPNATDVSPYKQLFLRSNLGGGSSESLGVNNETDIVRRIVINTPINSLIHDMHSTTFDCVTIHGKPEITQLWFQLIDIDGKVVNTHGTPISFSIIFQEVEE